MVRVKRGVTKRRRKKRLLAQTKGFRWQRKSSYKRAKEALMHSLAYATRDRKRKKREMRRLWQIRINAALKKEGLSYSRFIHKLKEKNILLDRKILSNLAQNYSYIFKKVVQEVTKNDSPELKS